MYCPVEGCKSAPACSHGMGTCKLHIPVQFNVDRETNNALVGTAPKMERKLTAIVAMDVVGYSGLMERSEEATLEGFDTASQGCD